jgi:probable F420-dependent oxidoreductase
VARGGVTVTEIGVVFPQTDIGSDAGAIRAYAEAVEEWGYRHVMIYDHVVGADTSIHPGWDGPYDLSDAFHEPFVLYGYLAGVSSLALMTGIVVLPPRQTVLVAKQAVELDLLTRGRLRLGVGLGWNKLEYESLGVDYSVRGRRIVEQIELMRALWTNESITFRGEFEQVTGAGLNPRPIQQPIPIWYGGESPVAYRRAGTLADGWIPDNMLPGPELDRARAIVESAARNAGRDPGSLGMQGRIKWGKNGAEFSLERMVELVGEWRKAGATHVAVNTMYADLPSIDEHLRVLENVSGALRLRSG